MNDSPRVAAVVVTHNRKDLLAKCLRALLSQTTLPAHIFVVDNASTDGTADTLPRDERVSHVRLERNLGGAHGFAVGVDRAAQGDFTHVWVMDDDCFAQDDALAHLLRHDARHPGHVLCSAVVTRDARFDLNHRRTFDALRLVESPVEVAAYEADAAPIDLFTFVGSLIPTSVVREAGLPVDDFFFMADDSEYALRLGALGVRAFLVPSSRVWHHGSVTYPAPRGPYNELKQYYTIRNCLLVYRRYGRSPWWFAVRFSGFALRSFAGLAKHRALSAASARITLLALRDALRGRAFVRNFGPREHL